MPHSRELLNKKNTEKDKHSRGPPGSGSEPKKGGAGAHNWGNAADASESVGVLDRGDPNYDSEEEKKNAK